MAAAVFEFGEFVLDCERFELRRGAHPVRIERKPLELLILLASSGGRLVTRDEIARCLWPSEVFVDTEHGTNTAIRKIRHALRDDPDKPRFLQTVTGKGYRFTGVTTRPDPTPSPSPPQQADAHSTPQPPSSPARHPERSATRAAEGPLYFAGITLDPDVQSAAPLSHEKDASTAAPANPRALWLSIISGAALAAVIAIVALATRSIHAHTAKPSITSIAVLPLDNLSGDPSQDYLAAGMTDELTTQLAKDSTLRVISRTSVMQFKGVRRPLPEIARELNVDGILEGSLSRSGDNLHMTVQLIHAPTDTHLWAESYDRNPADLVSLPRDAALTIARKTNSSVPSTAPQKYVNPAAHDLYLQGNFHWFSGDQAGAIPYYLKATQIQPDYAPAWSGLADAYGAGAVDNVLDPRQALPLAVAAAQKALDLDPSLARAHGSLAADKYWLTDWNLPAALNEFTRSTDLDPRYTQGWHMRGKMLIQLNRFQEGLDMEHKAMEIDPFARPWGLVFAYLMTRNFDAAIRDATQRLETHPDATILWALSEALRDKGMEKESEQALEKALYLSNQEATAQAMHRAFARGGPNAVLRWRIADLDAQARKHYVSPYLYAVYYARLGDRQKAFSYLDESLRQHAPALLGIQSDTAFDSLHSDPHYRAIVQKVGLPPAW